MASEKGKDLALDSVKAKGQGWDQDWALQIRQDHLGWRFHKDFVAQRQPLGKGGP